MILLCFIIFRYLTYFQNYLKKLVNIVDNFERALNMKTEENSEFLKGFEMIMSNIINILEENGVKEIRSY